MAVPVLAGSIAPALVNGQHAPLVVLGPSLGTTTMLWADVASRLARDHRVLRYDLPGHGNSPVVTHAFELGEVADAVINLVDSQGGGSFYYAGDSLGSGIGLELAVRHPDRVLGLAVFCGGARLGTPNGWHERARVVRASGTAAVRDISAARWFSPDYLKRNPAGAQAALDQLHQIDGEAYSMCCDALAHFDFTPRAGSVSTPTVCVAGEFDVASPPAQVAALAALVAGAKYVLLPGAGHVPALEQPDQAERIIRELILGTTQQRKAS